MLRLLAAALTTSVVAVACSIGSDDSASNLEVRDRPEQLDEDIDDAESVVSPSPSDDADNVEPEQELAGFDLGSVQPGAPAEPSRSDDSRSEVDLDFGAPQATKTPTPEATTQPSPTPQPTAAPSPTSAAPTATEESETSPTATSEASPTADETTTAEASPTAEETTAAEASPTAEETTAAEASPTAEQSPEASPTATEASGNDGEAVYTQNCAVCHGADGQQAPTELGFLLAQSLADKATVIEIVTTAEGFDPMPAFGGTLTTEQIEAVADYVVTTIQTGF